LGIAGDRGAKSGAAAPQSAITSETGISRQNF